MALTVNSWNTRGNSVCKTPLKKGNRSAAVTLSLCYVLAQMKLALRIGVLAAAGCVVAMLIWQAVTAQGAPDPLRPDTSPTVAFLDIGILVFREGLECILVLAAITASMAGPKRGHRRPVAFGAAFAFVATLITWFVAVRIVGSLSDNMSALDLQAATGLLAIVVLLVIMNWFFHKIYWGGWIRAHNRRRKALLENARTAEISQRRLWWGLILLGFTSLYREGFEVVLFLQSYHLRLGGERCPERRVVGSRADRNGRGSHICSPEASAVSQNANYHRHSAGGGLAGNGRRASTGNATGPLDPHYANQFS